MTLAARRTFIAMAVALSSGCPDSAAAQEVDPLPSWRDGVAKQRIFDFVANVTRPGPHYLPPEARIVLFDDDGTLWEEQAMPLARALTLDPVRHPVLGKRYSDMVYTPMTEMLAFLRAHGFTPYIVSGGDVDTIRPWASKELGVPGNQIVRSRATIEGEPVMAFVSADAGFSMIARTTSGPGARLGVIIDHAETVRGRETDAVHLLADAPERGWLVVDVARDWREVHRSLPWPEH